MKSQLEILDNYQQQLDEGLRNQLPVDKLEIGEARQELSGYIDACLESVNLLEGYSDTSKIQSKCERMVLALDTFENNYVPLP